MGDETYYKLAKVLDTLPNGFPSTESGVEIKLLKKIFSPDEAELFCDLRLVHETSDQIAQRTGRPKEGLEEKLIRMQDKGQIMGVNLGGTWLFKMVPWAFGIYELQLRRLDKEFVELNEEFMPAYGKQFFSMAPQMMQTLPIEAEIKATSEALPYERVSTLVDESQSIMVMECICKKEEGLLDNRCDKPIEVCMAFAPIPGVFDDSPSGRVVNKEEARALLKKAEEAGLVHMTNNFQNGRFFICNCCGCCCGVLKGINKLGIPASTVVNSFYYAMIDPDVCTACGTCADERCQVHAIKEGENAYKVIKDDCIGCGLCITTCPNEAISLVRKKDEELVRPPADEMAWYKERGVKRGVDFSKYQ
jgi:Fe-S-cluster-containing hydrogenase component 2